MRFFIFSIFALLFLGTAQLGNAQTEASSTASTTDSGGFFETIIENVTGISETVTAPSQSVLSAALEKRLTNLAANISNRLDGLNARLRHIAGRLNERANKLAAEGYNVDSARTSLQKAYQELDAASNELKTIDKDVYRAFRSQNPKAEWREVRITYLRARDNIQRAHTELKNTVSLLKSATPQAQVATSTATST